MGGLRSPKDSSILPLVVFEDLAVLFDAIEEGQPWPNQLEHGKALALAKTTESSMDPEQQRLLLFLPIIYSKWVSGRLNKLRPWVCE